MDTTWTLLAGALIRLAAMGIGGFLCFLGYRLFSIVPLAHPGDAEFSGLKGTTIKLTRIGPGIFFAFFGTLMVIWAINQPISIGDKLSFYASCQKGLGDKSRGGLARFGRRVLTIPKSRFSGAVK